MSPSKSMSIPINVDAEVSVQEIVRLLGREQVVELVKALDLEMADWGLTLELCDHFAKLREEHAREEAEDAGCVTVPFEGSALQERLKR